MALGKYILGALKGNASEDENLLLLCERFKEAIQSASAEELKSYLLRTEFNFDTVALELTFSFAVEQDKCPCQ